MAKVDYAMNKFAGFPGYQGNPPTDNASYQALFGEDNPWINKPTWAEVELEVAEIDKEECKAQASKLLYETDWTTIPM